MYCYLDYNSSTPIFNQVVEEMYDLGKNAIPYNPSSIHYYGRNAKNIIDSSRAKILETLGADSRVYNVVFTSSATEANNLMLAGDDETIKIASCVEHASILNLNPKFILSVDKNCMVEEEEFVALLESLPIESRKIVSVQIANNETGALQDILGLTGLAKKYSVIFHTDASQAIGKIPCNIQDLGCDSLTISAHKFGGPQGIAALIVKKNIQLSPLMFGGGQEYNLRPGTQNIYGIVGMATAIKIASTQVAEFQKLCHLRDYLEENILKIAPNAVIFCKYSKRLPNTSSIAMPNVSNQTQVIYFDTKGFATSAGSACSSGTVKNNFMQLSMGYSEKIASTALRISLGLHNTKSEIDRFIDAWKTLYLENNS